MFSKYQLQIIKEACKFFLGKKNLRDDYYLAGKKNKINRRNVFQILQIIKDNYKFFLGINKRLIPNLGNKRKYKLHYQNLKLNLNLGL